MMKMRNSGDIPRVAGQSACAETARVVSKIGNDHFDKFQGKFGDGGRTSQRGPQTRTP